MDAIQFENQDQSLFSRIRARILLKRSLGNRQRDDLEKEVLSRVKRRLTCIKKLFRLVLIHGFKRVSTVPLLNLYPAAHITVSTFYEGKAGQDIVFDSPCVPFKNQSFDLVVDCLTLHHHDKISCVLSTYHELLVDGGLFIGVFFGGETLIELRNSLMDAEIKIRGGASMRVTPTVSLQDSSRMLQRSGFSSSVADLDKIKLQYVSFLDLLREIKFSGEISPFSGVSSPITKEILTTAENFYKENYASPSTKFPATLDLITLTGWKNAI